MLKEQRILYSAKNFQAGLADVRANIKRNGTTVASNVALAELDASSFPGIYELVISPAQLTSWGGVGTYEIFINSASRPAPAVSKLIVVGNDEDDLNALLVTMDTKLDGIVTTLGQHTTKLNGIETTVNSTNSEILSGTHGLSALQSLIATVQSQLQNVQNNVSFSAAVPTQLVRPDSGTKTYRVPVRVFDSMGNPEDPDSNEILVRLEDESGNDRSNLLSGYSSGPVPAIRDGIGLYHIDIVVAGSTQLEQINAFFHYVETNGAQTFTHDHPRTTEIVEDIQASGLAQQATSDLILTDTTDIKPRVVDIQSKINSATYGLAALKALVDNVQTVVDANSTVLNDAGFGLAAIQSLVGTKASQVSVDNIAADLVNNVKGAGFNNTTDSLKAISDRIYSGGQAV